MSQNLSHEERDRQRRIEDSSRFFLVERPCCQCLGSGYRTYGSTALYHGAAAGQMVTQGVCDRCWGSGDEERPWVSHRKFELMEDEVRTLRARVQESYDTGVTADQIRRILAPVTEHMPADFKDWHQNSPHDWPRVLAALMKERLAEQE